MTNGGKSIAWLTLCALVASGCAGTLPDPIYGNQVQTYFPDDDAEATTEAEGTPSAHELRLQAGHCAARLNGHRSTAETVSIIQGIISGIGGVTGGVGGALSVVHFDSPDINTAMGVMGSIGAGITLVGNFVLGLLANPLEEVRLQGLGLRSWELAVELQLAHGDRVAVSQSLLRCASHQGPETHVVGSGEAYSE